MNTTDNKGAMTAEQKARVQYFVDAFEMNGVGDTVATVQDSPGTHVAITVADLRALLASQPVQAAPEAVDEDAAFKQWMMWHHDYDLCLTNEFRKSARAGWDARARLGVSGAQPAQAGHSIRHVDGRWRTLDSSGMPDWTDEQAKALCFSLRAHADLYAQDDPEDVRIIEVAWSAKP